MPLPYQRRILLVLLPLAFVLVASVNGCGGSNSGGCIDFAIGGSDVACTVAGDCSFVGALHVCPNDPSCGDENAINKAGADRYAKATASVPLKQVSCGAPSPVACIAQKCVVVR